jgi:ketosteroid isomerase-like protein
MKKWFRVTTLACLFALPAMAQVDSLYAPADTSSAIVDTTQIAPAPPATEAATRSSAIELVRALEARRQNALVAADTRELAEILASDASFVHANGIMQTPSELFTMLERGEMRYVSFALEDVRYRAYGPTVVVTGAQRLNVKSAGKSIVLRSRYTVVYAIEGAGAKMVAYQSTPTPKVTPRP